MIKMKKIKYNISKRRKTDYFKFSILASILFIVSATLIIIGTHNILVNKKKYQTELNKLNSIEQKSDDLSSKRTEYEGTIKKIKSKWNNKVKLVNILISNKKYSYIKNLNTLEDLLPVGVYISHITFDITASRIRFDIIAYTYSSLMEAYKSFRKHDQNLTITGETQSNERFSARLQIKLKKNETH